MYKISNEPNLNMSSFPIRNLTHTITFLKSLIKDVSQNLSNEKWLCKAY